MIGDPFACLPTLVQKSYLSVLSQPPPRIIRATYTPHFFQLTVRIFSSTTYTAPNIELRILRGKMKVSLEALLFDIVPVSRPRHSVRRDFLNNRMASLEVARRVLSRFSRATALYLTLYGRRESYRPMVSAKKYLYI